MNKKIWGLLLALTLLAIGAAVWRQIQARQTQAQSLVLSQKTERVLQLQPQDVEVAGLQPLWRSLPISGTLKANQVAMIKAKLAGELQEVLVREGDSVNAGQVLARLDPYEFETKLQQARQNMLSAKAQMELAQRTFENNRALVEKGFISKTALDTSTFNFHSATANLLAAESAVKLAQKALNDTWLKSPIQGQVSQKLAQAGERVGLDARILEVVDLRQLELEAALSAEDLLDVKPGVMADLHIDGLSGDLSAKLVRINPSAQSGSRHVGVYFSIGAHPDLRHGQFAQGWVRLSKIDTLALPLSSVRTDQAKPYVLEVVMSAEGTHGELRERPVVLGMKGYVEAQPYVQINAGLTPGSRVLKGSVGALPSGIKVMWLANVKPAP